MAAPHLGAATEPTPTRVLSGAAPAPPTHPRTSHVHTPTHARSAHQLPSHTPAVAVIYYSVDRKRAPPRRGVAGGAEKAGAQVRLRQVPRSSPAAAVAANPAWHAHRGATRHVARGHPGRPAVGGRGPARQPTRFGLPAAQLKQFIDQTGGMWFRSEAGEQGLRLVHLRRHRPRRQEATILALNNTFYHWGGIIVPPGYTADGAHDAGNPYGASHIAADGAPAADQELLAARHLGPPGGHRGRRHPALRESVPFHSMAGFRAGDRPSPEREAVR